ncbi:hypothetical protein BH11PAT4_BH11PAT4_7760 [soil metagenome]
MPLPERPPKSYVEIPDAVYGRTDSTSVQFVLHSPFMQRTTRIKQLGGAYLIFPDATHTRFSHMKGTAHIVRIRCEWLLARGQITQEESLNVQIAAALHDVGHDTFSHLIELLRGSHDEASVTMALGELAHYIVQQGGDPEFVAQILRREHPLSDLIFPLLGADKLDYLVRDALFAGKGLSRLDDLFTTHVRWEREVGIFALQKGVGLVVSLANRYWEQYSEIYERHSTRVFQRYLQELLRQMIVNDTTVNRRLHHAGEDGVMGAIGIWCEHNQGHECAERHERILGRDHPKKAVVFAPRPNMVPLRIKPTLAKVECSTDLVTRSEAWSADQLAALEGQIAVMLQVSPARVSLSPSPPARRWSVPKVQVQTGKDDIMLLGDIAPNMAASAQMWREMSCTVALSVTGDLRERVVGDARFIQDVHQLLLTT